jgi:multiple sugar transport system substrate-binding protein
MSCKGKPAQPTINVVGDEWFLSGLAHAGAASSFEQKTGIRVHFIYRNDQDIMADLDQGPKTSRAPYDVVVMRHQLLGSLIQKKQVRSIDDLLQDPSVHDPSFHPEQQLFPSWWKQLSSYEGRTYGYPFDGLTAYLCYRKDLMADPETRQSFRSRYHREIAPPKSWAEYMDLAEFFNQPAKKFYGTYISGKQGPALWYEWLNMVYSFGGNVLDAGNSWEYGNIVVNSPQNIAATKQYIKLIAMSPPDTLKYGWNEAQSALQHGNVFMGLLWNDQAALLEDPTVSQVAGKIGYSLIPSATSRPFSQMEGLTYLIPTESQHPQDAYRFMEWAMTDRVQVQQTLKGGASVRTSVYEDPGVKAIPYTSTFLKGAPVAVAKPSIPEATQIERAAERRLSEILVGQETPQAGLDSLALDIQRLLGGKAKLQYPVHSGS